MSALGVNDAMRGAATGAGVRGVADQDDGEKLPPTPAEAHGDRLGADGTAVLVS